MNKQLEDKIREIVEKECFKDNDGMFYSEIYIDQNDELSEEEAKKICSSENPLETFDEWMFDAYGDQERDLESELWKKVFEDDDVINLMKKYKTSEEEVQDFIRDIHYVKLPYDFYMDQPVYVDIFLDAGDGNYDFTLNQPFASWDGKEATSIDENSSLLWLAKQQGFSKTQLTKALRDRECGDSTFLKSVLQEVENTSSWMNAVAFFVQIPLRKWFELHDAISKEEKFNDKYYPRRSKGRGYLVLDKNTHCGLYDAWNGAGGVLELTLERQAKIPFHFIDSILPDGGRGYSATEIWGIGSDFWSKNAIMEIHPMKNIPIRESK